MLWNCHWGLYFLSILWSRCKGRWGHQHLLTVWEVRHLAPECLGPDMGLDIWPQNAWDQTALLKKGGKDAGGVPQRRLIYQLLRVKRSWLCLLCSNTSHPTSCFAQGHLPRLKNLERWPSFSKEVQVHFIYPAMQRQEGVEQNEISTVMNHS